MELIVPLCIVGGVVVIGLLWFVVVYNRFVSIRQHLKESWADVDVELKRRYELIPNLVRTVKGYASHERDVFDAITKARAAAIANTGDPARQSGDEQRLVGQLGRLFVVAEAYPDLKADRNFLDLQEELSNTEDRIAASRRFYNGNVRELNTLRESFPSSIVASIAKVEEAGFFEVSDHAERAAPKV
jgi:LemA protein